MFIIHLLSFKWDEKSPFPSFTKLSSLMGVSPSATRLYARKLETKGYLERQSRDGKTSTFDLNLLFVRLEARWNASSYFEDSL